MIEKTEMRSQFEAQFIEEYVRVLGEGARELAAHTLATNPPLVSMSWWAWQASRESVVVELPARKAYESHADTSNFKDGFNHCHTESRELIEAQGLKVAP